jgi:SulP family sulfate permease
MVVSALIFVLGIDLVKEALWDTRHRVSKPEYITIASIMVAMTVWDFVIGVLFGIVVSCERLLRGFFDDMHIPFSS